VGDGGGIDPKSENGQPEVTSQLADSA